ncbi:hypothetical protein N9C41_00515 [Candidatus Marinimicrobia bacterium]|jgi:hypothetical protein|nr:hypothetical protein [Candidatus Neomarinimicrobiota bacterium]MDA9935046.1 hypothetical protein [Candidatus Neomarinimicrobiota bacterium]|tara:strand:- start:146 stop:367 length:222 start_codon:yes stop_codon:yes gene_type:complete
MKKPKNINPYIVYTQTLVDIIKEISELNKSNSSELNHYVGSDKIYDDGFFNGVNKILYLIVKRLHLSVDNGKI